MLLVNQTGVQILDITELFHNVCPTCVSYPTQLHNNEYTNCRWEAETTMERVEHTSLCAETEKIKSLTLVTLGWL